MLEARSLVAELALDEDLLAPCTPRNLGAGSGRVEDRWEHHR